MAETMIGELAALGAAISWTVSALFYRKALEEASPISANIIRLTLTGSILLLLLVFLGKLTVLTTLPLELVLLASASGIIGLGLGDTLYFMSLKWIGVARAVPLTCIYPLFSVLWAVFLVGERITLAVVLGAVVIVLGILFLGQDSQANTTYTRKALIVGMVIALATAAVWSVSITMMDVAVKESPDIDHALIINTIRVITVAAVLLASSPIIDRKLGFLKVRKRTVVALIAGGIAALGVGWFFLSYSFTVTSQARAVPISSTTPLFSTLAGILLLREKVTAHNVFGSIMVVVGIFLLFLV
jgi:drug/metabolite transporter (DMT)-like permease